MMDDDCDVPDRVYQILDREGDRVYMKRTVLTKLYVRSERFHMGVVRMPDERIIVGPEGAPVEVVG